MNARSLRFQLLVWYTTLLGGIFALFAFFVYAAVDHFLEDTLRKTLRRNTGQIASSILAERGPIRSEWLASEISSHYAPESSGRFMRVRILPNDVIYASGIPEDHAFDPKDIPTLLEQKKESQREVLMPDGKVMELRGMPLQ